MKLEVRAFAVAALLIVMNVAAHAADPVKTFDIGEQAAATGLNEFARQGDVTLAFSYDLVATERTRAVHGSYPTLEALSRLLQGTKLGFSRISDKTIAIGLASSGDHGDTKSGALHFSIPGESLEKAIKDFQAQSGLSVSAPPNLIAGKSGHAVKGAMSPTDAMGLMLKDSGLSYSVQNDGTLLIQQNAGEKQAQSAGAGPEVSQAATDRQGLAEILVKGSRIMNVDVTRTEEDAQPYTIFDTQQIQQSGAANVEDFLKNMLTMNTASFTYAQQYGAGLTTSSINLRGLGASETLILIDGRRSASVALIGFGTPSQPDINGIPLAAIERIEVLPGSASAIYGGAAMGGVVNIILKKKFEGGDIGATYDNTFDASSARRTVNATYGFTIQDGRTRVMLSGQYSDGDPLALQDRLNLVQRGVSSILTNSPSNFYNSSNPFPGATTNIACQDANGNPTNCVLRDGTSLNSPITSIPSGAAPGSNLSAGLLANAGKYNLNLSPGTGQYGLQSQFGTVPTTKSAMATVRHEFTDSLEAFVEISTVSNSGRSIYDPIGSFGNYFVPATAPDNPFQQAVTISIPNTTSVVTASDSVTQSATVGLIAHMLRDWRSELDYTWSRNSTSLMQPIPDFSSFPAALAVGTVNPFADTLVHPLNLIPYIGFAYYASTSTLNDLALRLSGPVGSLPWGRPTLTIGLEHRKEGYDDSPSDLIYPADPASNYADFYFLGQSQSTDSVYGEAIVPLVTEKNALPGIRTLELQVAGRSERYTVYTKPAYAYGPGSQFYGMGLDAPGVPQTIEYTSTNPTVALKYQPVRDVAFRTSYATAFLPPTPSQLLPNHTLIPNQQITDPRNGETYDVNSFGGGNPNLQPQMSRTWDLGLIWEPQQPALQGLRLNLEYYKITQPNYITTPSLQQILDDPAFASRVTRDPTTARITVIDDSPLNAIEYQTNGWDLILDYRRPTTAGTFALHAAGTLLERDLRQYAIGSTALDYAGFPGSGGEVKLKANATVSFERRQWTLAWTTTYFGSYQQSGAPGDPCAIQTPGCNSYLVAAQGSFNIPSQIYHDIFASYAFDRALAGPSDGMAHSLLSGLIMQFGIKNVFNTLPPFDAGNPPYFYSTLGDPRLRTYRLTVRKSF